MAKDREGEFKFCSECGLRFYRKPKIGDQDWHTRKYCSPECVRTRQKKEFKFGSR